MSRVPLTLGTWDDHNTLGNNNRLGSRVTKSRHSMASPSTEDQHQGYQSLQQYSQAQLKKTSGKYSRDGRDESITDETEKIKAFVNRVEANSAQNGKFDPKVIAAKPWKRPSISQMANTGNAADVLAASKKPSATLDKSNGNGGSEKPPQFYFGQPLRPTVTNGHHANQTAAETKQTQTAIDKVKNNEAVSHPKNIVINPGYRLKDYVEPSQRGGKPVFAFGDKPPPKPAIPMKSSCH